MNVGLACVFPLIDKDVDGCSTVRGSCGGPVFYFLDFGDPGCGVWISFVRAKTMVLIRVIVENVV